MKTPDTKRVRDRQHLGRCLAQARGRAQLSQEAAGERLGLSRVTITKWETGVTEPLAVDLQRLADLYHLTLDQLTGRAPLPPPEREDA